MSRIVVKKEFNCNGCNAIIMKAPNQAGIKYWSGHCRSCAALLIWRKSPIKIKAPKPEKLKRTGSHIHNWKPFPLCVICNCELKNAGKSTPTLCRKCFQTSGVFAREKNPFWKGGITEKNHAIRSTTQYKEWAKSIKERDDYTCQICKVRGGILHSDHIKPFCLFPELRFDINNGRTLCKDCHQKHGWSLFKEDNPRKKKILT